MQKIKRTKAETEELKALMREFLMSQAKADFYECNREKPHKESIQ